MFFKQSYKRQREKEGKGAHVPSWRADFSIEHDGTDKASEFHGLSKVVQGLFVILAGAMREVKARDTHVGVQLTRAHLNGARSWT